MRRKIVILLSAMMLSGCAGAPDVKPTPSLTPSPAIEQTPMPSPAIEQTPMPSPAATPDPTVNDKSADLSAYEGFTDEQNAFVEISLEASLEKIEQGESFMIYYGKPNCPWCIEAVPVLNEAAKENGAVVYYVDTSKPENYSEAMIEKIMTLFEGWLLKDEEGEEGFYVPDVALIVNGRVAANHIATVDSHDPYAAPMSEAEQAELKQIYTEMIKKLTSAA
ncbi:hypothetical protein [Holdemania filiformis]|uniref:hypothetical protein n=1 Tax=Holdemania filiformis TaxID=61171 RepID=UPI00266EBE10|nr:hypothetical protein [Holdemania filiformis]